MNINSTSSIKASAKKVVAAIEAVFKEAIDAAEADIKAVGTDIELEAEKIIADVTPAKSATVINTTASIKTSVKPVITSTGPNLHPLSVAARAENIHKPK